MKVLIVKTSSLGDVIHSLPALTDAVKVLPGISFDWVVEESFQEIPRWHSHVQRVIPMAWRRWRKDLLKALRDKEMQGFYKTLRLAHYDKIIDAQGLMKSAVITLLAKGPSYGLDFASARENFASFLYKNRYKVVFEQHAVVRMRQLFAQVLDYPCPKTPADYGISQNFITQTQRDSQRLLFFHGTTWEGKKWPEAYWQALAKYCVDAGFFIDLPWGNEEEKQRAEHIASVSPQISVLPKLPLKDLAQLLMNSRAVVAVDTGLGHLAAALGVCTLSLYGPTDPTQIGACGANQFHLTPEHSHSLLDLPPERVWRELQDILSDSTVLVRQQSLC